MSEIGQQAGFPQIGTKVLTEENTFERVWYRFLIALWRLAGGDKIPITEAVYFLNRSGDIIQAYSISSGELIGVLALLNQPGETVQPRALAGSPYVFVADQTGTLTVSSGKVELSRDLGATYYQTGLAGGSVPLLLGDQVRVSWTGGIPLKPTVAFFPGPTD